MVNKLARRVMTAGVVSIAALTIGATSASAHFCYFTDANIKAQAGRAGSNGFIAFGDLAMFFAGCEEGAEMLIAVAGVAPDTLINAHGLMARGAFFQGREVKPISHLDVAALEAATEEAMAACED